MEDMIIPTLPIILVLACLMYLTASLIKIWKKQSNRRREIGVALMVPIGAYYKAQQQGSSAEASNNGQQQTVPQALLPADEASNASPPGQERSHSLTSVVQVRMINLMIGSEREHVQASREEQVLGTNNFVQNGLNESQKDVDNKIILVKSASAEDIAPTTEDVVDESQRHNSIEDDGVVHLNLPQTTRPRKIFKVIYLGGFISGVIIMFLVTIVNYFEPRNWFLSTGYNIFSWVLMMLPVFWIESIPVAREFMFKRIRNIFAM